MKTCRIINKNVFDNIKVLWINFAPRNIEYYYQKSYFLELFLKVIVKHTLDIKNNNFLKN